MPLTLVQSLEGDQAQEYEGHCIVCHERFGRDVHLKLKCCDARYHPACLDAASRQMMDTGRCILCSQSVDPTALFVDLTIAQPAADRSMRVSPGIQDDLPDEVD